MEQFDLFIKTPEKLEQYLKTQTVVSILGGTKSEKSAELIGHDVAESGFSIRTGGYATGSMKGGLLGGGEGAIDDPELRQKIEGVTSADFKPYDLATKGKNITTEVADDSYERLRSLIRKSDILVITEGSIGTDLEIYAAFGFELELEIAKNGKGEKPLIIVGQALKEKIMSVQKFADYIAKSENIVFVDTPEEVTAQVEEIFQKIKEKKRKEVDITI